jgi:DNA primase
MEQWLLRHLSEAYHNLPEEALGYCLGRGLPESILDSIRIGVWVPPEEPTPDRDFESRFGKRGEAVAGWLSIPIWNPSGSLVGVEFRTWQGAKNVMKHFLPSSKWNPMFVGLSHDAVNRIWGGSSVWLVEGLFDLAVGHVAKDAVPLACGGARLSRQHADFLARFMTPSSSVYLCFDEDVTGRGMAEGRYDDQGKFYPGARQRLEARKLRVSVVRYRGGKDPGEIWENGGREALHRTFGSYL